MALMVDKNLTAVFSRLEEWRSQAVAELKGGNRDALALKLELDHAIGCMQLCRKHGFAPDSRVLQLPDALTRSPSSSFRLVEDHESDDRQYWTEVVVDGEPVQPLPRSFIVEP